MPPLTRALALHLARWLAPAVAPALVTALALRWIAPSWWPAAAGLALWAWSRRYGAPGGGQAVALWLGQAAALSALRGFSGYGEALLYTSPLLLWPLLWLGGPWLAERAGTLALRAAARGMQAGRLFTLAVCLGSPVLAATLAVEWGRELHLPALGVALAAQLTRVTAPPRERWFWLTVGILLALALFFATTGVLAGLRFMPYEMALFLAPMLAGFVVLSLVGAWSPPARQP